jgi:hypothetical protein
MQTSPRTSRQPFAHKGDGQVLRHPNGSWDMRRASRHGNQDLAWRKQACEQREFGGLLVDAPRTPENEILIPSFQ